MTDAPALDLGASEVMPCRECHAPIFFARTEARKTIPIDAVPNATRGNLTAYRDALRISARVVPASRRTPGGTYYISHFATCTAPSRFRRA